jgi:hypothetical protein
MSFNVGDFVELDAGVYGIVLSSYNAIYSNDEEYEEMFIVKVIDSSMQNNKNHYENKTYDAVYYALNQITDEKIINKLNKLITFQ